MHKSMFVYSAVIALMMIIMGITAFVTGAEQRDDMSSIHDDFNEMQQSEFYTGKYVSGEIYELWNEFAYEEQYSETFGIKHGSVVSSHYYIMPLQTSYESDTPVFIAVCLRNQEQAKSAQRMIDGMNAFWDGETDDFPDETIYFTGKVTALDGELLDYFYEWLMYGDEESSRAEYDQYVCPYILTYIDPNNGSMGMKIGVCLAVGGLVFLAVMILIYLKLRKREPQEASFSSSAGGYIPFPGQEASQPHTEPQEDNSLGIGIDDDK